MSINNYINMVRYNRFEEMCRNKCEKNMTELIFEYGFSSLATFYRVREMRMEENSKNRAVYN